MKESTSETFPFFKLSFDIMLYEYLCSRLGMFNINYFPDVRQYGSFYKTTRMIYISCLFLGKCCLNISCKFICKRFKQCFTCCQTWEKSFTLYLYLLQHLKRYIWRFANVKILRILHFWNCLSIYKIKQNDLYFIKPYNSVLKPYQYIR
jgi:hypothetical protein